MDSSGAETPQLGSGRGKTRVRGRRAEGVRAEVVVGLVGAVSRVAVVVAATTGV
jgi:hypothetical protein